MPVSPRLADALAQATHALDVAKAKAAVAITTAELEVRRWELEIAKAQQVEAA